jgi:HK97 family phage portal protein
MHPRNVTIVKLPSGRYRYDCASDDGKVTPLLQDEVFHLRDRTEPGSMVGKSRIAIARDTLGLGLAVRAHGSATFRSGARPSGILESDRPLSIEQHRDLTALFQNHTGTNNAGGTLVLPKGITFKALSMNLEDAQWIAAQQFSVEEVCRIFRVPPTMVGDLRHGNYSNTAELGSQFVRYSLARPIAMWESEIQRSLLGPIARRRYNAEHSVEGLLRGNPEARADFYQKAIAAGWMTVNEVRKLENLPQIEFTGSATVDE